MRGIVGEQRLDNAGKKTVSGQSIPQQSLALSTLSLAGVAALCPVENQNLPGD